MNPTRSISAHRRPCAAALALLASAIAGIALAGCGSSTPPAAAAEPQPEPVVAPETTATFPIKAGEYAAAFEHAKWTLREAGFILERVDAWSGVITTRSKGTAGLATLWDQEQLSASQEMDDLFNRHRRQVRITFRPSAATNAPATEEDLRIHAGDLTAFVQVTLERLDQPGWRLDTNSIRASTYCSDPAKILRSMEPTYVVASAEDRAFGAELAQRITKRAEARP